MVKLAENAGFGIDKIENYWEEFNKTKPKYEISFDSVILKLYPQTNF
jgi:predicted HTH transcriptional regulator